MIGIVDYNMGNLASVINAFKKVGADIAIESDPDRLKEYNRLILPGVGAFGDAMKHLEMGGMGNAIKEYAKSGKPLLGICLGMQLLFETGQEFGTHKGLGVIEGSVVAFNRDKFDQKLKVPHIGWNELFKRDNPLFNGLPNEFYLYFVHLLLQVQCLYSYQWQHQIFQSFL